MNELYEFEKSLSCSKGISYESVKDHINITKLINLTDEALYKAKKNGKHGYVLI
jgi:GGDEF domain-containing protein